MITFKDAAVQLGGRTIWSEVSFEVEPGHFVAVLGPNGAGKSTLVKAMLGLVPVAAGEVLLGDQPPRRLARDVGYLPQRRSFDASAPVRGVDIVRLGLDGDRWGVPLPAWLSPRSRERTARVGELIDLVEAATFARRPIGRLSGGEQQRLLIAQALAREPALLALDEPLDSLDVRNQGGIASLLGRICRDRGVTVVMVAHDVNPILPYLDRVIYVARGRVVAGSASEVITTETLSALYGTRVEVLHTSEGAPVIVGHDDVASHHPDLHAGPERHLHG